MAGENPEGSGVGSKVLPSENTINVKITADFALFGWESPTFTFGSSSIVLSSEQFDLCVEWGWYTDQNTNDFSASSWSSFVFEFNWLKTGWNHFHLNEVIIFSLSFLHDSCFWVHVIDDFSFRTVLLTHCPDSILDLLAFLFFFACNRFLKFWQSERNRFHEVAQEKLFLLSLKLVYLFFRVQDFDLTESDVYLWRLFILPGVWLHFQLEYFILNAKNSHRKRLSLLS